LSFSSRRVFCVHSGNTSDGEVAWKRDNGAGWGSRSDAYRGAELFELLLGFLGCGCGQDAAERWTKKSESERSV
jgi:hypothetical protein